MRNTQQCIAAHCWPNNLTGIDQHLQKYTTFNALVRFHTTGGALHGMSKGILPVLATDHCGRARTFTVEVTLVLGVGYHLCSPASVKDKGVWTVIGAHDGIWTSDAPKLFSKKRTESCKVTSCHLFGHQRRGAKGSWVHGDCDVGYERNRVQQWRR